MNERKLKVIAVFEKEFGPVDKVPMRRIGDGEREIVKPPRQRELIVGISIDGKMLVAFPRLPKGPDTYQTSRAYVEALFSDADTNSNAVIEGMISPQSDGIGRLKHVIAIYQPVDIPRSIETFINQNTAQQLMRTLKADRLVLFQRR